jgi:hypothetical protein
MQVSYVPLEYLETVWPQIEGYLDGAARYSYGRFKVEDIKHGIETKPQQLWVAYEDEFIYGAVVTEVVSYPQMKALDTHFTGGIELPKWKTPMLEILQKFAKDNGCKIIESYGRPGWEKVFTDDGFKKRFMFYELPVEKEA